MENLNQLSSNHNFNVFFYYSQKTNGSFQKLSRENPPLLFENNFIQKVRRIIEENIEDESFGIQELCKNVYLSRSQLHNKIKASTNLSTSIFIRHVKLKKAKYLLENNDYNVSEVAYKVGFKNPAYFSRVFIEMFGVYPSKIFTPL